MVTMYAESRLLRREYNIYLYLRKVVDKIDQAVHFFACVPKMESRECSFWCQHVTISYCFFAVFTDCM